jgi:hypothetical protein
MPIGLGDERNLSGPSLVSTIHGHGRTLCRLQQIRMDGCHVYFGWAAVGSRTVFEFRLTTRLYLPLWMIYFNFHVHPMDCVGLECAQALRFSIIVQLFATLGSLEATSLLDRTSESRSPSLKSMGLSCPGFC